MTEKESTAFFENWREFFVVLLIIAVVASVPILMYFDEKHDGVSEQICMENAKDAGYNKYGEYDPECDL